MEESNILLDDCKIVTVHYKMCKTKTKMQAGFKETFNITGKLCKK